MYLKCAANRQLSLISVCLTSLLACALFACTAGAQTPATDNKPADAKSGEQIYQTLYLTYATEQNSFNDIETDLRNILPRAKIFGVASQNAISLRATAEDIETAKSVLADLDKPRKVYRLTYTITAAEGSQPGATQHYTLIVASGDRTVFKEGSRVPIVVGSTAKDASQSSDVPYLDVGLSINASLATSADALTLHSKVELSSVAAQTSGGGTRDPDVRQTVLDGTSILVPGKPLMLGSLDAPGATRHEEVEVLAEQVK
jgi:type II secretory pathway component GspD/PulD (secretin)